MILFFLLLSFYTIIVILISSTTRLEPAALHIIEISILRNGRTTQTTTTTQICTSLKYFPAIHSSTSTTTSQLIEKCDAELLESVV